MGGEKFARNRKGAAPRARRARRRAGGGPRGPAGPGPGGPAAANTNNCTQGDKQVFCTAESGPRWFTSVVPYYYRCHNSSGYCANSSKYSYGCTGERKFLCSGCSYCENGIGYADWSDSTGGL